ASLLTILVCACATSPSRTHETSAMSSAGSAATAVLEARSESSVTGTARVSPASGGIALHVEVQGATPGEHGVHIHEKGDCSDPKATSAGGHYNPAAGAHHGGLNTPVRHGGDLGNMQVDSSGKGTLDVTVPGLSVAEVVGKAVVVHEKSDDLQTDPAGNSGARVACGVLQGG
ncbi:MAG: superoxide dismutase family protein, partial [Myxococcales bacterium]